jgi:RNase H-fold protein (predicted Holliday junction resolvase)
MVLSLIYGRKYAQSKIQQRDTGVSLVTFDTMVSEEHKFSSRVTYYPVESGTIVSDHIINQPDVVVLSGLVTDTPLNIFAPFNRSVAAFNQLIQIHERRTVIDVVTGLKVYKNMAITSLDVPRTIKTGQTLTFNIQLQKIVFDDTIQVLRDTGNVFAGIQDVTPRAIVAENANIPIIQNDPQFSLKDQASSATNVGVQSLASIPTAVLPNVLVNLSAIAGVV